MMFESNLGEITHINVARVCNRENDWMVFTVISLLSPH